MPKTLPAAAPAGEANRVSTLSMLLRSRAADHGGRLAYGFLRDGHIDGATLSYAELDRAARACARVLRASEAAPGDRALLLYPPGLEFLIGFFGCLYAGLVPIPAPPPDAARVRRTFPRLRAILDDAGSTLVVSTRAIREHARMAEAGEGLRWVCHEDVAELGHDHGLGFEPYPASPSDLAYLQYTSGSTSTPKGVMLTHANVISHLEALQVAWDYRPDSVAVTWMPYFHDYGLVDGLLEPMFAGIPCHLMSPLAFVKRPLRWLEAISRLRATHTQGPNFAYALCLERIAPAQRDGLDLSSLRVASSGAEPVRADTLRRFAEFFAPNGLRAEALYPAYGLAEDTLLVSTKPHGEVARVLRANAGVLERIHQAVEAGPADAAREVVSCGPPVPSTQVAVVDAEGRRCADGQVGEIWVAGPSVAVGYWRRPDDSRETFAARLVDAPLEGPFLRTGDLGFLRDGEVHVTGRSKDLIIVDGANHYPQDIEWTVQQAHSELRPDHCIAFGVEINGEERLVIAVEANRPLQDWQPVLAAVRRAVSEAHEIELHALAVLRKGAVPKTSSGKLQRRAGRQAWLEGTLETLFAWRRATPTATRATVGGAAAEGARARIAGWLADALTERLGLEPGTVEPDVPFASFGLTSRLGVQLVGDLEAWLGRDNLSPTLLWEYPSVSRLSAHLAGVTAVERARAAPPGREATGPIAIVGMACRLPGADDTETFWRLLSNRGEALREVPDGRWDDSGIPLKVGSEPGCIATLRGGFIDAVEGFDAEFFGIGRREAEIMDPQQRLLLETAWHALEDAGLDPQGIAGSDTGVFIGISTDDYALRQFGDAAAISAYTGPAKAASIAANRISYQFDLQGPSLAIDTACSSSLVAIHQAARALNAGECGLALAGGVNLLLAPQMSVALTQAGMLAPDGRCKAFDSAADGYVRGEGCGVLVLKRLADAQRDGDAVLAVIRGSAVNQDGRSNGLTAPNGLAQRRVVAAALAAAGVAPAEVGYVEAHGTGTALGDPIEVSSLAAVLGEGRTPEQRCALGAVKANIGHLEAAAGVAGIIKAVLALQHETIPPHPTLKTVNPLIALETTPFFIPTEPVPWPGARRIAGVSSFGFGGTNAHLVLEAAPAVRCEELPVQRPVHLLTFSAHDRGALRALALAWAERLDNPDLQGDAGDFCRAAHLRAQRLPARLAVRGEDRAALAHSLRAWLEGRAGTWTEATGSATSARSAPRVAFLFTGQGAQSVGMGIGLYRSEPGFRRDLDEADAVLRPLLGESLVDLLYGEGGESAQARLARTEFTQPALFAVEVALARLWMSWGVRPTALAGHSVGEYAAACVAGVFSFADGLRLVAERARRMQTAPGEGGMLAVSADEETAREAIGADAETVVIAVRNAPRSIVLAGPKEALASVAARLGSRSVETQSLAVSHAFHSPMMDPAAEGFEAVAADIPMRAPDLPVYSNVTGEIAGAALADPGYWARHLRAPVRFADGLAAMLRDGLDAFVEIGPRPVLLGLGRQASDAQGLLWLPSLRPRRDDHAQMLESLGELHVRGGAIDWRAMDLATATRRVPAPAYPFQHRRHWLPAPAVVAREPVEPLFPGRELRSPLLPQIVFENDLALTSAPLLDEHRVFGRMVVPGAGHLSLLAAAADRLEGAAAWAAHDLVFPSPLLVPERGSQRVQLVLGAQAADARQVSLIALDPAGGWRDLAVGELHHEPDAQPSMDLGALRTRCPEPGPADFYADAWQPAIALGPSLRWVQAVSLGVREVLAELRRPSPVNPAEFALHPGLLDSMLQVLTLVAPVGEGEALVPFRIERFRWWAEATAEHFWSHLALRDSIDANAVVADVSLISDSGRVIARVEGLHARRIAATDFAREVGSDLDDALWATRWESITQTVSATAGASAWTLVGRDLQPLFESLRDRGVEAVTVDAPASLALAGSAGVVRQGSVLWLLDVGDAHSPAASAEAVVKQALDLVRVLTTANAAPRLLFATRGAQQVVAGDLPQADQASVWGLARVIALEHPQLRCRCVDLPAQPQAQDWSALAAWLAADSDSPDAQGDFALRDGRAWAPRLARTNAPRKTATVRADGCQLITGGLGALGLAVAQALVARGARHLRLVGRTSPDPVRTERIDALRAEGVRVDVLIRDVAALQPADLAPDSVPLAGVFHLAGVLGDALLDDLDAGRVHEAFAPKLGGAWALHRATLGMRLDHFVCFSSAAGVTGSLGQGAYAAANAAMDALVAARRALGLPGTSIQWGPWSGEGMASRDPGGLDRFAEFGIDPIEPAAGLMMFARLLAAPAATTMVLPVDWQRHVARLHADVPPGLLHGVLDAAVRTEASSSAMDWSTSLAGLERGQQRALIEAQVRDAVSGVLGISDPADIGARERLFDRGLDSLGAVELRNRLAQRVGRPLRSTLLFDFPTLEALVDHIARELIGEVAAVSLVMAAAAPALRAESDARQLAAMPEDELARMLAAELGDTESQ